MNSSFDLLQVLKLVIATNSTLQTSKDDVRVELGTPPDKKDDDDRPMDDPIISNSITIGFIILYSMYLMVNLYLIRYSFKKTELFRLVILLSCSVALACK